MLSITGGFLFAVVRCGVRRFRRWLRLVFYLMCLVFNLRNLRKSAGSTHRRSFYPAFIHVLDNIAYTSSGEVLPVISNSNALWASVEIFRSVYSAEGSSLFMRIFSASS